MNEQELERVLAEADQFADALIPMLLWAHPDTRRLVLADRVLLTAYLNAKRKGAA